MISGTVSQRHQVHTDILNNRKFGRNDFICYTGGSTVIEEAILTLVSNDPSNNITVECNFMKTRALWVECPPTVIEAGNQIYRISIDSSHAIDPYCAICH
jgi:hypothetical protein